MAWSMKKVHDEDPYVNDFTSVQIFWYNHPNGTSFKALRHWTQVIKVGEFRQFDYGKEGNLNVYGTEESPLYDLSKIKDVPIALLSGKYDMLATPTDIEWTKEQLKKSGISGFHQSRRPCIS